MLGLELRREFQGRRLKGTEIELTNEKNTGATQVPASEFLEITHPTRDVLRALEALEPGQGRPVVLLGERGQGKSHLLAVLHHALTSHDATAQWLKQWAQRLGNPKIAGIQMRQGMTVIAESLHRQRYTSIWDLLFDRHPHGKYILGKWAGSAGPATDIPSDKLILELLDNQPLALLLDEFQVWFDGLTNTKQSPRRTWAFNFIQILSEIAKEHPEKLLLVVSVRNGNTDAYQQIHRVHPIAIDFKGPSALENRRRLLLHRLFENRPQIHATDIEKLVTAHVSEVLRLRQVPPADHDAARRAFLESWPFAPHLWRPGAGRDRTVHPRGSLGPGGLRTAGPRGRPERRFGGQVAAPGARSHAESGKRARWTSSSRTRAGISGSTSMLRSRNPPARCRTGGPRTGRDAPF